MSLLLIPSASIVSTSISRGVSAWTGGADGVCRDGLAPVSKRARISGDSTQSPWAAAPIAAFN